MLNYLRFLRSKIGATSSNITRRRFSEGTKPNIALDKDDYKIRNPGVGLILLSVAFGGYLVHRIWLAKQEMLECEMNRQPLGEREREPNMKYLQYRSKSHYL
uniref:Uncharacterized LOC100183753 n=1 Tax=Ciona intestinalis TaxID=7719 RepID=F6VJZ3_CIOIN|nr:uncharacterized protein LOC100183753 [Ciona intestinalis]|eukprot:XP_002129560.1 uncharacterized protein LOC100183753 [Ciona intestinalis]